MVTVTGINIFNINADTAKTFYHLARLLDCLEVKEPKAIG